MKHAGEKSDLVLVGELTMLNPEVDVYLMQHGPHALGVGIGQEDESEIGGGLEEVQLVLPGRVAGECVFRAADLADHVAEREDGAEDELGVVGCGRGGAPGR